MWSTNLSFFFFLIMSVRTSLYAPQLIFRDPEVNDHLSL